VGFEAEKLLALSDCFWLPSTFLSSGAGTEDRLVADAPLSSRTPHHPRKQRGKAGLGALVYTTVRLSDVKDATLSRVYTIGL
jgi:hypothetical protein